MSVSALFALAAIVMTVAAVALMLPALRRGGIGRGAGDQLRIDTQAQLLAEIDDARRTGLLSRSEHADLADQLLREALEPAGDPPKRAAPHRWQAVVVMAAMPLLAGGLYGAVGHPTALTVVDTAAAPTVELLQAHVRSAPDDGRAWVMLGRLQMERDRFADAAQAFERAIAVSPRVARDAEIWCEMADALGMLQGGSLQGRPRELINRALELNGSHPRALEMAGGAAYEAGDYKGALVFWEPLLALLPPQSTERQQLEIAVSRVRERAARG